MNTTVAITFVLIVLARITDVTLDTLRTASIVQGRRLFSSVLSFFEAFIYICAVAQVLLHMDHRVYALAYGLGFALGTFLGIVIEQYRAFGHQLAALFTRKGLKLTEALLAAGYRVAQVQGHVHNEEVTILYVKVSRKRARPLIRDADAIDEACFCVLNDVRVAAYVPRGLAQPT
jgi:uncharacterized protein YebE (UPF0316 family)